MKVKCPYCNSEFNQLTIQHLLKHGKTLQDLKIEFPNSKILSDESITKMKNKYQETCTQKYGVEYTGKLESVKLKKKETCIINYGADNPSKVKEIRDKIEETWLKKYGVKNPSQAKEIKFKKKESLESGGFWRKDEELSERDLYYRKVNQCTNEVVKIKFSEEELNKRGRNGTTTAKQIDHIYSIDDGFKNKIPPEIIGHFCNVRLISWEENCYKWKKSEISIDELYILIEEFEVRKEKQNA